ncbi:MAG: valine--tRNA ligase [Kofleriaceae bacterium]|nr:valine--tRNA ligase [Kofleriaceae bacterium]MCL4229017.1 valine--tRNA ligase [Myxococcales bacterium]
MSSTTALTKQYDPSDVEPRWLRTWLEHGYYHADEHSPTVPFSITLPPPNVTGSLHMGHALGSTLQDILIRWRRMQGFNAMWMPGTDHASIAVHVLLEKELKRREGRTRQELGREAFLQRAWAWRERSGSRISEQEKVMGFSLDWQRERFTMDDASNRAVREAFVRLHDEGLIYRAKRMINWDPASETVVSDLEVDTVEENGHLWELRYPLADGSGRHVVVATTRPETMLGDTGVAVHPDDDRYRDLVGQEVELPLTGRRIPIVADTFVEREFGSGAVKVTPAHDFNDHECAQRTGLPALQVIDARGRMCAPAPDRYVGLTVDEARKAVVADLDALGLLGTIKDHKVPRGRSQRSGAVIEPMLMEQWFVKTQPLAAPAVAAVESGKTRFVPELWTKTYMHWMTNIRDWCISRQLWWGHRIPAWYCDACDHVTVARVDPTTCAGCGGAGLRQDDDILDTWFSSALWPFSTLGWPERPRALTTFYPNNVLVTGPDIIFFWVARMMMMGLHFMGKVPFRTVYLTSIVTDENGDKMSKTKGNTIDPLDVIHGAGLDELLERAEADIADDKARAAVQANIRKHFPKGVPAMGADALRFALAALNTSGRYIRLSVERVEGYRNFINKLWNASRFALMNLDGHEPDAFETQVGAHTAAGAAGNSFGLADRWILSRLQRVAAEVDAALESYRFNDAAGAIYQFVWHELCDWYIELAKPHLHLPPDGSPPSPRRRVVQGTLAMVLEQTLRLLHPMAPFVTEEIWQKLPKPGHLPASLMVTIYPRGDARLIDEAAEREMALVQEVAVAIRMLRSTYNVPPSWSVPVEVRVPDETQRGLVDRHRALVENAARVTLSLVASGDAIAQSAKEVVGAWAEVVMPLAGLIDVAAEKTRLGKDIGKAEKEIGALEKRLANPQFLEKAPEDVVVELRARLAAEQTRRQRLIDALAQLG